MKRSVGSSVPPSWKRSVAWSHTRSAALLCNSLPLQFSCWTGEMTDNKFNHIVEESLWAVTFAIHALLAGWAWLANSASATDETMLTTPASLAVPHDAPAPATSEPASNTRSLPTEDTMSAAPTREVSPALTPASKLDTVPTLSLCELSDKLARDKIAGAASTDAPKGAASNVQKRARCMGEARALYSPQALERAIPPRYALRSRA